MTSMSKRADRSNSKEPEVRLRQYIPSDIIYQAYRQILQDTARELGRPVSELIIDTVNEAERTGYLSIPIPLLTIFGIDPERLEQEVSKYKDVMSIDSTTEELVIDVRKIQKKIEEEERKKKEEEKRKKKEEEAITVEKVPTQPPLPERIRPKTEVKREKEKKREEELREAAIVPSIPREVVFGFITDEHLRDIVMRIMRDRLVTRVGRQVTDEEVAEFLKRMHTAAIELGYVELSIDEWLRYSDERELEGYRTGTFLQVVGKGRERRILIPTKRPRPITWLPARIGLSIRNWLLIQGDEGGSPYEFYRFWRIVKSKTSYAAVVRAFHILEVLGLIRLKEQKPYTFFTAKYRGNTAKLYYVIVKGKEADPRWNSPAGSLYPASKLGSKRYHLLKAEGLVPRGRATQYI